MKKMKTLKRKNTDKMKGEGIEYLALPKNQLK